MKVLYLGNKKVVEEILRSVATDMECEFSSNDLDGISKEDEVVFIDYEIFKDSNDIDINAPIIIASSSDNIGDIDFEVLYTPFLPNDVYEILEDRCSNKESIETMEATILDPKEIEIVKSFLEDVESDIKDSDILINENQEIDTIKDSNSSIVMTPDELIAIIDRLKTKRLRKLLRGATIELKITFPKDI